MNTRIAHSTLSRSIRALCRRRKTALPLCSQLSARQLATATDAQPQSREMERTARVAAMRVALTSLLSRAHSSLLRAFTSPRDRSSLSALVADTECVYRAAHFLWHHAHTQAGEATDDARARWTEERIAAVTALADQAPASAADDSTAAILATLAALISLASAAPAAPVSTQSASAASDLAGVVTRVHQLLRDTSSTLATAESLTGGRLCVALTDVPGASDTYLGGVVTYAAELKASVLGVDRRIIAGHGVVSVECAAAMASGVRALAGASYGLATTGVAGPTEQEGKKPGTVFVGITGPGLSEVVALDISGSRQEIQERTCAEAFSALEAVLRREKIHDLDYCAYYCQQFQFEQTRFAKVDKHKQKCAQGKTESTAGSASAETEAPAELRKKVPAAQSSPGNTEATAESASGKAEAMTESASDAACALLADLGAVVDDEEEPSWSKPKSKVAAPLPTPMRCCHAGGSCHLQSAASAQSEAAGTLFPFPPFLLWLHSIFLLRMLFAFLFNDEQLIPVANADLADAGGVVATPTAVPSLTRLCLSFLSWPPSLLSAVHAFADNIQFVGYAHMIVNLRQRGAAEGGGAGGSTAAGGVVSVASPSASSSSAAPFSLASSSPLLSYPIDGRVWKRAMDQLKLRRLAPAAAHHSAALQSELNAMLSAAPCGMMSVPISATATPPVTLFVLGDSHSLTLHGQWLCTLIDDPAVPAQHQRLQWMQARTQLIVGLKAWHVGQVKAEGSDTLAGTSAASVSGAPLARPAIAPQSSALQSYARLVPAGSTVLLVAGEIDCRSDEGMCEAVAKGRYPSLADAIRATVTGVVRGARILAGKHGWRRVLIHPVCPPFVRGNRSRLAQRGWKDLSKVNARALMIRDYNTELKSQIEAIAAEGADGANRPSAEAASTSDSAPAARFHYLNFYDDLCVGDSAVVVDASSRQPGQGNRKNPTARSVAEPSAAAASAPPSAPVPSRGPLSVAPPSVEDGGRYLLRAEFTLEGMHLNAKYAPQLEREIERAIAREYRGSAEGMRSSSDSAFECQ